MLRNLFTKTFRDQRLAILAGTAGIIAISLYLAYFYPFIGRAREILKTIEKLPPFVRKWVNPGMFATPEGFFNLQPFSILAPLILIGYAIIRGSDSIAGEEERGTLDLLLACPLSRSKILLQKLSASALVLLILSAAFWLGMAAGCWAFSIPLDKARLLEAVCSCYLLALAFLALSLAAGCWLGRRKASATLVGGYAILAYLVQAYAPAVEALRPWQKVSLFYYYNGNMVLLNGLNPGHAIIQAALTVAFSGLALFFFQRRDLHA